jgi:hypothetical protein
MRRPRMMWIMAPLALVTLLGAAPWRGLPACVLARFRDITSTDGQGTIIGASDPSDWGCLGGQPERAGGVPVLPPTQFCFEPAYPNPATGAVRLSFSVPQASPVSVTLYGQKHGLRSAYLVRTLSEGNLATGRFEVLWDGNDEQGARVPPGIYRAVMTVPEGTICGDIEIR